MSVHGGFSRETARGDPFALEHFTPPASRLCLRRLWGPTGGQAGRLETQAGAAGPETDPSSLEGWRRPPHRRGQVGATTADVNSAWLQTPCNISVSVRLPGAAASPGDTKPTAAWLPWLAFFLEDLSLSGF